MPDSTIDEVYFTKHLFRTGLECPTRLYYYAHDYPENREALPFIAHYRYNKEQLIELARCHFPKGVQIDSTSVEKRFEATQKYLGKNKTVLFDPVFIYDRFKAKVPILEKNGDEVTVYHVQTKTFRPEKHNISSNNGDIYPKWSNYVLDFAYQVYVIGKCYPDWKIRPYFLLPSKYARANTDELHKLIREVRKGKIKPKKSSITAEEILERVDVLEEVTRVLKGKAFEKEEFRGKDFEELLYEMAGYFFNKEKYPVEIGNKCRNCEFRIERERVSNGEKSGFIECWNEALDLKLDKDYNPLVFNLIGPGTKHWVERSVFLQENIPEDEFYSLDTITGVQGKINEKQRQSLQIIQAKGGEVPAEIVKPKLFKELSRWEYPIHFLDFEAGNYVIPVRKDRRPYHLLVFQFSCHTLYESGEWRHHEWLDDLKGKYPNYEMVRNLMQVPDITEGTIVQYSNFERNALKNIRKELREDEGQIQDAAVLSDWIQQIVTRHDSSHSNGPYLSDLSRLVKHYYYNAEMEDSLSIKDVLQSIMSISPRLKDVYTRPYSSSNYDAAIWWQSDPAGFAKSPYRLMLDGRKEEGIRRGTEAMVVYARLLSENLSLPQEKSFKKALLRYCEMDTLAMFMIYQHWQYLMEENWN